MRNVLSFIALYFMLNGLGILIMSMLGMDLISAFGATIASVGNIGPGFGTVRAHGQLRAHPGRGEVGALDPDDDRPARDLHGADPLCACVLTAVRARSAAGYHTDSAKSVCTAMSFRFASLREPRGARFPA